MGQVDPAWRYKGFGPAGIAMHIETGALVRLNRSALWLMEKLVGQVPDDAICREYSQAFGVGRRQAADELSGFRQQLLAEETVGTERCE